MTALAFITYEEFSGDSQTLDSLGATVITSMPYEKNNALIEIGRMFGYHSIEGVNTNSNFLEDGCVHVVVNRTSPAIDPFGNTITSTTNDLFELHTDEYFSDSPAKYVFLLCVEQSVTGGESTIAFLEPIMERLDAATIELLQEVVFPSQAGYVQILKSVGPRKSIRFNHLELMRSVHGQFGKLPSVKHLEAVEALREAAMARQVQFKLWPGDCLVLRNDKVLHGRNRFGNSDNRILKRLRVK